jgi:hypothetical protein
MFCAATKPGAPWQDLDMSQQVSVPMDAVVGEVLSRLSE